jgi:predicted transcriptional regulator
MLSDKISIKVVVVLLLKVSKIVQYVSLFSYNAKLSCFIIRRMILPAKANVYSDLEFGRHETLCS